MHLLSLCKPPLSIIQRRFLTKTLLIMKFTAILMVVCSLELTAKGFGQTITLNLENVPIQQAFKEIEKQSAELKKANEALSSKFDIEVFPTVVILSSNGSQGLAT